MSEEKRANSIGLKVIVGSVVGILLSLGMCGLGFYLARDIHDGAPPSLDILGGFGFVLSLLGLGVGIVIAIVEALSGRKQKDM